MDPRRGAGLGSLLSPTSRATRLGAGQRPAFRHETCGTGLLSYVKKTAHGPDETIAAVDWGGGRWSGLGLGEYGRLYGGV